MWLYGGYGEDITGAAAWLSDLWRFDGRWTWMSGSNKVNVAAVAGGLGVFVRSHASRVLSLLNGLVQDPANTPGGRGYTAMVTDSHQGLWLIFGSALGAGNCGHFDFV
jgi:hypothetical protein